MKSKIRFGVVLLGMLLVGMGVALLGIGNAGAQGLAPQNGRAPSLNAGIAFTYQGQLKNNGAVVNNTCDFQFDLWDSASGGLQVSVTATQTVPSVSVSNGLFTTPIDFGASTFTVRANGGVGINTNATTVNALTVSRQQQWRECGAGLEHIRRCRNADWRSDAAGCAVSRA